MIHVYDDSIYVASATLLRPQHVDKRLFCPSIDDTKSTWKNVPALNHVKSDGRSFEDDRRSERARSRRNKGYRTRS